MRKLEICCYTVESAILAEKAGAHRIELCDNYLEGGTTPSYATIKTILKNVKIPVNIIVRPRGGDFLYSNLEYEIIKEDILKIKGLGANGVVTGFLLPNGEIDIARTSEIVKLAYPLEVTFHRAFDMCENPVEALEQLKGTGITRILTSGAKNTALDGVKMLSTLVKNSDKAIIMPGSGINEENLGQILEKTNALEFHSSAKIFEKSKMKFLNNYTNMSGNSNFNEYNRITVNTESIQKMAEILSSN